MNAETKHTPGPWAMETVRTSCGLCHKVGPFPLPKSWRSDKPAHACIYDDYPPHGGTPELVANARLIAAAPELLEALVKANELYSTYGLEANSPECGSWINSARAAIAKAAGNAP